MNKTELEHKLEKFSELRKIKPLEENEVVDWERRRKLQLSAFNNLYDSTPEMFDIFFEQLKTNRVLNLAEFAKLNNLKEKSERKFRLFNLCIFL